MAQIIKQLLTIRQHLIIKSSFPKRNASTIFALSSGFGKCGVAVIRISGPEAANVVKNFGGFKSLPEARKAILRRIRNPNNDEILDQGLVLWFPGPKSFTGEDCCEFHIHGGTAVIASVLSTLGVFPNLRHAEPGEFTKRAFYAGKFDLTAVEGLNDLINAETEFQRKQALFQMEGSLASTYSDWKTIMTKCLSDVEALIDFGEDQDIDVMFEKTRDSVKELYGKIQMHVEDGVRGERLRNGVKLAIVGAPNVGKSSLLNKICRRPAAIVSPLAGTTRDLIRIDLDLGGYPVILVDTAGIRVNAQDQVEKEGINRAKETASDADLILLVIDCVHLLDFISKLKKFPELNISKNEFSSILNDYINNLELNLDLINSPLESLANKFNKCLLIFNKVDMLTESQLQLVNELEYSNVIIISCETDQGVDILTKKLISDVSLLCGRPSIESPCYTQTRHRLCLMECLSCLEFFFKLKHEQEIDLAGHYLRMALNSLGKITGHVSTEQVLDEIFKSFCIGK